MKTTLPVRMRRRSSMPGYGFLLGAVLGIGAILSAKQSSAARWASTTLWESTSDFHNRLAVKPGAVNTFDLGNMNRGWFWQSAWCIAFHNAPMSFVDSNGDQSKTFEMKFQFNRPLKAFQFQTPRMNDFIIDQGSSVTWAYSTDGIHFTALWEYQGRDMKNKVRNFAPVWTPPQHLAGGPIHVWIRFTLHKGPAAGYGGRVLFSGANDGGVIRCTAAPATAGWLKLLPAHGRVADIYYVTDPPRVLINLAAQPAAGTPQLEVFDCGRNCTAGVATVETLGRGFAANLPKLPPGAYELRLRVPGASKPIPGPRFALVQHPHRLTWAQSQRSPFGIDCLTNGVQTHGQPVGSADLNGPKIGWMLGVHGPAAVVDGWASVCERGPQTYHWPDSPQKALRREYRYGMVGVATLAYSPQWAVDMGRVAKNTWFGLYPPEPRFLNDYAAFCRRAAGHMVGLGAPEFEIWPEPNNMPYGGFKGTFGDYVALCRTAAKAVLSVHPRARMVLGCTGDADVGFIVRLFQAGLSKQFRIVDMHPYTHNNQGPESNLLGDIRRLRRAIALYGNHQSIIFSEIGWPTDVGNGGGYQAVSQFKQACYLSRTWLIALAAGVKCVDLFMLTDYGQAPTNPEFHFGIIALNGQPKLSVSAISTTTWNLERATFLGVVPGAPPFRHIWAWRTPWVNHAALLTIWSDTPMIKH